MKEFVLTVFGALVLSCIFNSIGICLGMQNDLPPYPTGSSISEVKESVPSFGCKRDDFCYPEMNLTAGKRPTAYITEINDSGDRGQAEFPWAANN